MGQSSGSKQANNMLQGTYNNASSFGNSFANTFMDRGTQGYDRFSGVQDEVLANYRNMLSGVGSGGGGGGIPGQNKYVNWWQQVADLGATSPEQAEALRGWGVPKDFALTGGMTDADKTNFRLQATASIPGFYDAMRRNMGQRAAVTGGYGPGFDAGNLALAREQSRAGSEASLAANNSLWNMLNENKKWGATTGSGMEEGMFNRMAQGTEKVRAANRQAAASRNAANSMNFSQQMALNNAMLGAAGQAGPDLQYGDLALRGFGTGLQGQLGAANTMAAHNPNRDFLDRLTQIGGAAAGVMGAFNPFGGGGKKEGE